MTDMRHRSVTGSSALKSVVFVAAIALLPAAVLFLAFDYFASYALPVPAMLQLPREGYLEFDPLQMWRLRSGFSAGDIHVSAEGFRSALPPPSQPRKLVFLVGGSTVFGVGMPEEKTIAFFLQQLADRYQSEKHLRFINAGVTAYYSTQELIHLERNVLPYSPAMVISLTGRNDAFYGLHPNYKPDAIPYHALLRERLGALDPYYSSLESPSHSLHSVNWLRTKLKTAPFDWLRDFQAPKLAYKSAATGVFLRNARSMSALLSGHGVEFHMFLQPTIRFPERTLAPEERPLVDDFYLPALDSAFAELALACSTALPRDWFHGFAALPGDPGQRFIDNVHLNQDGAREVAHAIFSQLFGPLRRK